MGIESRDGALGIAGSGEANGLERSCPQMLQNLKPPSNFWPQLGHCASSLDPHSTQKAESGGFCVWQFEHSMDFSRMARQVGLRLQHDLSKQGDYRHGVVDFTAGKRISRGVAYGIVA